MYVVRVMPIARGVFKDSLSFFSKAPVEPGTVVDVAVRGRPVTALVVESSEAKLEKSALKREGFVLKRLGTKGSRRIFSAVVLRAAAEAARASGVSVGTIIAHFSPTAVLTGGGDAPPEKERGPVMADILVVQAEAGERMSSYRNMAREAFARGRSVMLIAPTVPEAETLFELLGRGIEEQVVLMTGALGKKALMSNWRRAVADEKSLFVIATAQFLMLPRADIETLIVERESARSYVGREREALDARVMAECVAKASGARLILADFPMRVETRFRLMTHEIDEASRLQIATRDGARVRIVDVKRKPAEGGSASGGKKKPFSSISDYARDAIGREVARGGRVAVYAARRGVAPLTVCNDCGTPVTDPATGSLMTLEKSTAGNVFISHRSGAVIPAETPCRKCGGWNLVSLGIGVERVHDEIAKLFPDTPLFLLTADTAPSHAKAKTIRNRFFNTRGAIMAGTDRMIPYLEPIERSLVASADGMLSTPAWRAEDHAVHTLFALRDKTEEEMIIQTRAPDGRVIRAIASGNPTEFFEIELTERKRFGYPPFVTFIGLTWTGTEVAVAKTQKIVTGALAGWDLVGPLPARAVGKNRYLARAVVRLPEGGWPNDALSTILMDLPPDVAVAVDPDDIV
jgi:primosomal protein N'